MHLFLFLFYLKSVFVWGPRFAVYLWRRAGSDCEREYSIDLGQFIFCCPQWVALGEIASLSPVIVAPELKRSKKKGERLGEKATCLTGARASPPQRLPQSHGNTRIKLSSFGPKILCVCTGLIYCPLDTCLCLCVCTCTCTVKCIYVWG